MHNITLCNSAVILLTANFLPHVYTDHSMPFTYIVKAFLNLQKASHRLQLSKLLCKHVPDIWTDKEPESIRHRMFLSVLSTGPKYFKNSAC